MENLGIIIAIVGTGIAIVAVVMSMMFWVRQEANQLRAEQKEDRKDLLQISRNLENVIQAMQIEMKDFHQKLIDIEMKKSSIKSS